MTDTQTPTVEQAILSWKAPIHPNHVRTKRWYIGAALIILAILAYSIYAGTWSVALVAILCGGMYVFMHKHTFPDVTASITEQGIRIDATQLLWSDISGFWFLPTANYIELHLVPKLPRRAELIVQTGTTDVAMLKQLLSQFVPELDKRERLLDTFIRICKL